MLTGNGLQFIQGLLLGKISLDRLDPGNRFQRQYIESDHPTAISHRLLRVLTPAARRRAEIEYRLCGFKEAILALDLIEFKHRARTITLRTSLQDIGVSMVLLQPSFTRLRFGQNVYRFAVIPCAL